MDYFNLSPRHHTILDALADAKYFVEGVNDANDPADEWDFCSTEVLHDVYLAFCFKQEFPVDFIETDRRQFGRLLGELFEGEDRSYRVAVYNPDTGRRPLKWGYTGIKGPKSVRRRRKAGRPKTSDVEDPTNT